ncbi:uncharacterized protein LOC131614006 [Vicia villosa]|uniref:uncharacterized protein LOC131614006 n=1 Tax=Vicia villosa TaxID=3911 RepID=UPI00273AA2ED|nr:uncharacterized protein LOC131614006 [Vicia villosa]
MIVLSYNLRGCGSAAKRKCLRDLIRSVQVDICFIQESKLCNFDSVNVQSLWGESDMEWSANWAVGRFGGIITMWKVGLFKVLYSFTGDGFLGIAVNWKGKRVYVVNVYAPRTLDKKKEMWKSMREMRYRFQEGEWYCFRGDFNVVSNRGERLGIGVQINGGEILGFNEFISAMELIDLPVLGNRFTWFNLAGTACSRIDRFLDSWKSLSNIHGRPGYILKEKLSKQKNMIRTWNKEVFGILDLDVNKAISSLNKLDSMVADMERSTCVDVSEARGVASKAMVMKGRRRRNNIVGLSSARGDLSEVEDIRSKIMNHFANRFVESEEIRPLLDGVSFNCLTAEDCVYLEALFSLEEIKDAVWLRDCEKSPGPDSFPLSFLKFCWSFVGQEVMRFVQDFHRRGKLPKAITASFLALTPKINNPQRVEEFKPICLIGCLYRLLSKLLAGRLNKVMGKLVSPTQTTFIEGRQMMDGVVVLNEIADFARRNRRECLILKNDFEKAYDCVSWSYLKYMFKRMGFGSKWCGWMEAMVFSSNISVLVNGCPTAEFAASRGLRQGDPMSPFLFLLATEGLSGLMWNAREVGGFQGFHFNQQIYVELLQFADDTVMLLYGINVGDDALLAAANFLPCAIGSMPFLFLGLHVGANHRRKDTWKPVYNNLKKRVASWQGKHISLGGKLSFFKAPRVVWEEIIRIQRSFLWGKPKEDKRRMAWVNWDKVYRQCVWSDIMTFTHGNSEHCIHDEISNYSLKKTSLWWRDIRAVCRSQRNDQFWFLDAVSRNDDGSVEWGSGNEEFSVKDAYKRLYATLSGVNSLGEFKVHAIHNVWRAKVPENIKCFEWRFILNSMPTRDELRRRGVLHGGDQVLCPLCNSATEHKEHLFLMCVESDKVWKMVLRWLLGEDMDIGIGNLELDVVERFDDCLEVCVRAPFVYFFWLLIS